MHIQSCTYSHAHTLVPHIENYDNNKRNFRYKYIAHHLVLFMRAQNTSYEYCEMCHALTARGIIS